MDVRPPNRGTQHEVLRRREPTDVGARTAGWAALGGAVGFLTGACFTYASGPLGSEGIEGDVALAAFWTLAIVAMGIVSGAIGAVATVTALRLGRNLP